MKNKKMNMKKALRQKTFIVALLASLSIFGVRNSYSLILGGSPYSVILTGTVISPDEKGNPRIFELLAKGNKCRFKVTQAYSRSSSSVSGWRLLKEILPRRINLVGDEKVVQSLMHPDVVGKNLTLRGRLYVRSKKLHLSSVEEVVEEETPEEDMPLESK